MKDPVRYYARPSDEQLENLRAFAEPSERSDLLNFAGRDDILQLIPRLIQLMRRDPTVRSITQVIQGAPGAGKTSLLNELEDSIQGDQVSVVRMEGEDLSDSVRVAELIADSVGTRAHRSAGGTGISWQLQEWETRKKSAFRFIPHGGSIWQGLKTLLNVDNDHVFLLLIDEAQRADKTIGKNVNEIVTSLHAGSHATAGLRILPVFAGLLSTSDQLRRIGMTRQSADPHRLGRLSLDEARFVVEGALHDERTGLRDVFTKGDVINIARILAIASEGWPSHLRYYLTGLTKELIVDIERANPSNRIRINNILEYGHARRCAYYAERLQSADLGNVQIALMALASKNAIDFTISSDDIERYISEKFESNAINIHGKLAEAIHAGVLERRPELGLRIYSYPIPSFSTFMACNGEREQTMKNMRSMVQEYIDSISGKI